MKRVTGIGGVFFKSKDPKKLILQRQPGRTSGKG